MTAKNKSEIAKFLPKAPVLPSALARHRQLAPNANIRVSPLCLGAMGFGDAMKTHMGECSKETAFESELFSEMSLSRYVQFSLDPTAGDEVKEDLFGNFELLSPCYW